MDLSVSVIIPTYNYATTIVSAVDSVLNQSYDLNKIEIIIVDDGSTDNTKDVLEPYISTGKIKYIYQKNAGKAAATASAIKFSNGAIIFNLDADDIFLPNKISFTIDIYQKYPDVFHVSSPALIKMNNGSETKEEIPPIILNTISEGAVVLDFFYRNNILYGGGSTFSCRREVFDLYKVPAEADMYIDELLVILALSAGNTYFFNESLSVWNVHNLNYSIKNNEKGINNNNARLLFSSECILHYLLKTNFSIQLIKHFRLKHEVRKISFQENTNQKSVKDIFSFMKFIVSTGPYSLGVLHKYHVFNRLLPSSIYNIIKNIRN